MFGKRSKCKEDDYLSILVNPLIFRRANRNVWAVKHIYKWKLRSETRSSKGVSTPNVSTRDIGVGD